MFPAEYGAVFVDEPPVGGSGSVVAGAVLHGAAGDAGIAEQSDPRLVVLAHPIEHRILAETGYSWMGLTVAGRYVRIRRVVCRDCGTLFEVRRLTSPPTVGCQIGCVLGLVVGLATGIWRRSFPFGFSAGYGTVLGCTAVASAASWAYTRLRFRERARVLDGPRNCPRCGSGRYAVADGRGVFPCPECSEPSMRVRSVGMS
jgi:hypothetical protein